VLSWINFFNLVYLCFQCNARRIQWEKYIVPVCIFSCSLSNRFLLTFLLFWINVCFRTWNCVLLF